MEKDDVSTSKEGLKEIMDGGRKSVPNIDFSKTITSFAGVRATQNTGDFMIFKSKMAKWFINMT